MNLVILVLAILLVIPMAFAQDPEQVPSLIQAQQQQQQAQTLSKIEEVKATCVQNLEAATILTDGVGENIQTGFRNNRIITFLSVFAATFLAFMSVSFIEYIIERKKRLLYQREIQIKYGVQE